MRLAALAVVVTNVASGACGDNVYVDDRFEAKSGTRMRLVGYLYQDGTEAWEPAQLSDTALHARCTPEPWIDGVTRCVPIADEAVYTDAACTMVVGRARTIEEPRVFVGREWVDGARIAAHVYRAGEPTDEQVTRYYELRDGACEGPVFDAGGTTFSLVEEVGDIVEVQQVAIGDTRVEMRMRVTPDGLQVPLGLHDRELHLDCAPPTRPDDRVGCEPVAVPAAAFFRDPDCTEPVVLGAADVEGDDAGVDPRVATVVDGAGCTSYRAVGAEVRPPLYFLDGDVCNATSTLPAQRWLAVGEPLALAPLDRSVETAPGRRLQHVRYRNDDLDAVGDVLFDTATRATCRRVTSGPISRCLPAIAARVRTLYLEGCVVPIRVTELREPMCETPAFAIDDAGVDVYAIGAPVAGGLYHIANDGFCGPYVSPAATVTYELGPPLPPETFAAGVLFEDR